MENGKFAKPPTAAPAKPTAAKAPLLPPAPRPSAASTDRPASPLDRLKAIAHAEALTKAEAEALQSKLASALPMVWDAFDEAITMSNARHVEAVIWRTIDEEDNRFIASLLVRSGMASPIAATLVRQVVYKADLFRLGLITWPRLKATIDHYAKNGGFALPWQLSLLAKAA